MASPKLPANSSQKYQTLHSTAIEFINSPDQDPDSPTRINHDRIRAIRTPSSSFQHTWGHNLFASTNTALSAKLDVDGFIAHLDKTIPHLESWETRITDIVIDEVRMKVVVRASYYMLIKGKKDAVENDLVWFLEMEGDRDGDGMEGRLRVRKAVEFIDGEATRRVRENIMRRT